MQYLNKPVVAICLAVASACVQAQEATYDFNIPAQPVGQVLNALTKQTGLQPFYSEDSVKGVQSPGVTGKYSVPGALGKALAGTGLSFQFTGEKSVAIKAASATSDKVAQLAPITVVDTVNKANYTIRSTTTASKIEVPNRDIPYTVEARPIELLEDMGGPPTVAEMLKTVAGVSVAAPAVGRGGNNIRWFARGMYNSYIQRNGFSAIANYNASVGMANVEQIEVLQGPSSVLNGTSTSSGMGGQINIITKQPSAVTSYGGGLVAGSWDYKREYAYINGAINDAKTLLVRLDVGNETSDDAHKYVKHDTKTIAPAVTLLIGDQDTIKLRTDWTESKNSGATTYIPYATARYKEIPKDVFYGIPDAQNVTSTTTNALLEYQHKFANGWKFTGTYSYNNSELDFGLTASTTWNQTTNVGTIKLVDGQRIHQRDKAYDLRLDGHVDTWGVDHYLLGGITRRMTDQWIRTGATSTNNVFTTNLFNPNYNFSAMATPIWGPTPVFAGYQTPYDINAQYVQDLITFSDKYKLIVAMRRDDIDKGHDLNPPQVWTHNSYRAGFVWQPTEATAPYISYTESFEPTTTKDYFGKQFSPVMGKQYEVGVKQTFSERLDANVAYYELTRDNVLTTDPDPAHLNQCGLAHNSPCSIQGGAARVRGLEINVNGQIGNSFRMNAALAHIFDYKWIKSTSTATPVGSDASAGVPYDTVNLFGIYSFGGALSGFEAGGGVYYRGPTKTNTNPATSFTLPSTVQVDLMASYKFNKNTKLQFNVKNVTNNDGYHTYGSSIFWANPRAYYLNLKIDM